MAKFTRGEHFVPPSPSLDKVKALKVAMHINAAMHI